MVAISKLCSNYEGLCITWVLETIFAELAPKVGRLTFMELACGMLPD